MEKNICQGNKDGCKSSAGFSCCYQMVDHRPALVFFWFLAEIFCDVKCFTHVHGAVRRKRKLRRNETWLQWLRSGERYRKVEKTCLQGVCVEEIPEKKEEMLPLSIYADYLKHAPPLFALSLWQKWCAVILTSVFALVNAACSRL